MVSKTQKREIIQRAISAAMHIIYNSDLNGSALWPKGGVHVGWIPLTKNEIRINARYDIDEDMSVYKRLIINVSCSSNKRLDELLKVMHLIYEDSYYDGVWFENGNYKDNPYRVLYNKAAHVVYKYTIN